MKMFNYICLGIVLICIVWIIIINNSKIVVLEKNSFATEIEALENVQKQQNEQIQLSTTIQQLSSILQSTELSNKELADALGEIVIENGLLKIDLRRLNILISGLLRENAILKEQLKNKST